MPDEKINKINCELNVLRSYVPSEICRLPRAINDIEYWKTTELRTFLLYSAPIVLKGKITKAFYNHFFLLVYGIRILMRPDTYQRFNNEASNCLRKFVCDYSSLYGIEMF